MKIQTERIYKYLNRVHKEYAAGRIDEAVGWYRELKAVRSFHLEMFIAVYERRLLDRKKSFLAVNNHLVQADRSIPRKNILVLLPFCLQSTLCKNRVIWNLGNCKECGLCPVGSIKHLAEERQFTIRMAERGVMARDILYECKPDLTIAIACHDELFEGIVRARRFPVFGIPNIIQSHYCINTDVQLDQVARAIDSIL